MNSAAIFDLDRTLLQGASGPHVTAALGEVGLVKVGKIPGEKLLYRVYDAVGETLPSMLVVRLAAKATKGWEVELVNKAGITIADKLSNQVAPYARGLMEEHRNAGRRLVLATTTPYDIIEPFANLMGFDDVIATRYAVADGHYTGKLDGNFVWSVQKLSAVRGWASQYDIDLKESFAYSDSFYDAPLLGAVGHPFAVHPDPRLPRRGHSRVAGHRFISTCLLASPSSAAWNHSMSLPASPDPNCFPTHDSILQESKIFLPREGRSFATNHRSYFDVAAIGLVSVQSGRPLRFLAKKEVCDAPVVGSLARAMGAIHVERGSGSDAPLHEARRVIEAGDIVGIFPQGTIPRGQEFFEPVLNGRPGAARLSSLTGAPVVPVGIWGTERVWPRNARVPKMTRVVDPPLITVRVGVPIESRDLSRDHEEATRQIMAAITALLPPEARESRTPTQEENHASDSGQSVEEE